MTITPGATLLGKYSIIRLIGEGGMGRVWLAEESAFGNRQVAIKEPRQDLSPLARDEVWQRYQQEIQVYAALQKTRAAHIVPVYTVEPYRDAALLVMDYMAGGSLEQRIDHNPGGLSVEETLAVAHNLLTALNSAHTHPLEIVHRDVKPANVLFDERGAAYLADFGLAQLSGMSGRSRLAGGSHPGSPLYMAPEQAISADYLTPAADIFALGCVIFEMLTGKRYKRMRPGALPSSLRGEIPAWLDALVARSLTEDPWERYADAGEMLAALTAEREAAERARREAAEREAAERTKRQAAEWETTERAKRETAERAKRETEERAKREVVEQARQKPSIAFDWVTIPAGKFTMGVSRQRVEEIQKIIDESVRIEVRQSRLPKRPEPRQASARSFSFEDLIKSIRADPEGYRKAIDESPRVEWEPSLPNPQRERQESNEVFPSAPDHIVYLPEYRISRLPVTNDQYRVFVRNAGYTPPIHWRGGEIPAGKESHPVVYVSWQDAIMFCEWARVRLPSEAEWEKAARGSDGRTYTWGNQRPDKERCNFNMYIGDTTPVGYFASNSGPYGVLDMLGNVWEWTNSRFGGYDLRKPGFPYPYDSDDGREDSDVQDSRVVRGGSFASHEVFVRCDFRKCLAPNSQDYLTGFRVVLFHG